MQDIDSGRNAYSESLAMNAAGLVVGDFETAQGGAAKRAFGSTTGP